MPYPTGQPFNQLFRPDRFDLVYGRATARGRYLNRLPSNKKAGMKQAYVMLDEYNNNLGLSGGYRFTNPIDVQRFENVVEDRVNLMYPVGQASPAEQVKATELTNYATSYLGSKYSPTNITARPAQELAQSEGFTTRQENISWKIIRSSCKFGIEYVVSHSPPGRKVHFVLDDINDHDIIVKTVFPGYQGQLAAPITTSELRSVYRRWQEYQNHVLFYRAGNCILPPWDTNPAWDQYGMTRVNKYVTRLAKEKIAHPIAYNTNQAQVNQIIDLAARLTALDDYNGAVGLLKHGIALLTGGPPPVVVGPLAPDIGASGRTLAAHVKPVLDNYDAQKGFFRRKSQESVAASTRLRGLLNDFTNLSRAMRHYLDLDNSVGPLIPGGVGAKLGKSSTLYGMLMTQYKDWLGVREELDLDF